VADENITTRPTVQDQDRKGEKNFQGGHVDCLILLIESAQILSGAFSQKAVRTLVKKQF
jgi:hypothetical protein